MSVVLEITPVHEQHPGIHHGFDVGYAIQYGLEEAIMIFHFQCFIRANRNRNKHFHEGRFWTYDKMEDLKKHFPYWSVKQVQRIVKSLIDQGIIITGKFNTHWSNQTSWYAFNDQNKFLGKTTDYKADNESTKEMFAVKPKWENADSQTGKCQFPKRENVYKDTVPPSVPIEHKSLKVLPESAKSPHNVSPGAENISYVPGSGEQPPSVGLSAKASDVDLFSSQVKETGKQLIETLKQAKPDYVAPRNRTPIHTHLDFMIRLDKRTPQKILDVMRWALADDFWQSKMFKKNPAEYLRKQFDQLEMQMYAKPGKKIDRRTQDKDGNPVDAPWLKDRF